jgi:hypothetical protein
MGWGEQFGKGRCINCGFLSKRSTDPMQPNLFAASGEDRLSGYLINHRGICTTCPWCFRGKADFLAEMGTTEASGIDSKKMFELISRDRNCQSWYPWTEFVTPEKHFEEFKMLQLEKERRGFELKMENDRKRFELELQRMDERQRKRTDKVMIGLAIAGAIFALAEIFAALAALTPDSILFQWFR